MLRHSHLLHKYCVFTPAVNIFPIIETMHGSHPEGSHRFGPEYFCPSVSTYVNASLTLSAFFPNLKHNTVQFDGRSQHYPHKFALFSHTDSQMETVIWSLYKRSWWYCHAFYDNTPHLNLKILQFLLPIPKYTLCTYIKQINLHIGKYTKYNVFNK